MRAAEQNLWQNLLHNFLQMAPFFPESLFPFFVTPLAICALKLAMPIFALPYVPLLWAEFCVRRQKNLDINLAALVNSGS
jgi:hypothetical protein